MQGPFDTFVLYDVLEHLVDPAAVLEALVPLAAPGARAHVSVPNARHWTLMRDLVLRGTFGYTDWGHRDRTHLRWFTRRDIEALLAAHRLAGAWRRRPRSWGARPRSTASRAARRASSWPCNGTSWRSR